MKVSRHRQKKRPSEENRGPNEGEYDADTSKD
nr:MAG TPA: hypothetical protein [Caudoviricetes sp.]